MLRAEVAPAITCSNNKNERHITQNQLQDPVQLLFSVHFNHKYVLTNNIQMPPFKVQLQICNEDLSEITCAMNIFSKTFDYGKKYY